MRRSLVAGLAAAALCAAAAPLASAGPLDAALSGSGRCEWLAGDFHVHTVYSHDSWAGPGSHEHDEPFEEPPASFESIVTLGWTPGEQARIAESRGLDFIAITDHDDVRAQTDPEWGKDFLPGAHPLIWVPNYENTIPGAGHAQMHGATHNHFDEYEYDRTGAEARERGALETMALLRRDGGAFQINHPSDMGWHNADGTYKFEVTPTDHDNAPDALEAWNIGAWIYEPPAVATNDHELPLLMYNDLLDTGAHIAATGGSDNHWRATTPVQGVGQPTTWVCAESRTWQAIVAGVKAGRTTISHQPPAYGGPRVFLYADERKAMAGDTVLPGSSIELEVVGAPGATLRLITNGGAVLVEDEVTSPTFSATYTVPADKTWVRAEVFYPDGLEARRILEPLCVMYDQWSGAEDPDERNTYCRNRLAMVAMTSPIYFAQPAPEDPVDRSTTVTYDGHRSVRAGDHVQLSATLVDSAGSPLAGETVTFTFRGATYAATTDRSGRAAVDVHAPGPPGTYDVVSTFAGDADHDASSDTDTIAVTRGR